MNHNIVIDEHGNKHQAVEDVDYMGCPHCSLNFNSGCGLNGGENCMPDRRSDGKFVIYKRKIKLSDIIIKS